MLESSTILALGHFSPADITITISPSNRAIDPAIESQLEELWEKKLAYAKANNKICYNGLLYRLNRLTHQGGKLTLDLAVLEYKVRDGLLEIPEYFKLPEDYYRNGCYSISTVLTSDDLYLVSTLSGKSMNRNTEELIGGIVELTDPTQKFSGEDLFSSYYQELDEEAGIKTPEIRECYLRAVFLAVSTNVGFYFETKTDLTSTEILNRFANENSDDDIQSLQFYKRDEYLHKLRNLESNSKLLIAELCTI